MRFAVVTAILSLSITTAVAIGFEDIRHYARTEGQGLEARGVTPPAL